MMSAPPPELQTKPEPAAAETRVVVVSEAHLRLIDPATAIGEPVLSRAGRLDWRLRWRLWRARAAFWAARVKPLHVRLVEARLRLRLRWLRLLHGRRLNRFLSPPDSQPRGGSR